MLAYRKNDLDALSIHKTLDTWIYKGLADEAVKKATLEKFPLKMYTPNMFVRLGLLIFGSIGTSSAIGILFLFTGGFDSYQEVGAAIRFLMASAGLFVFAENLMRKEKAFYRAGLEEATLYTALSCLVTAAGLLFGNLFYHAEWLAALLLVILLTFAAIRYNDSLLASAAFVSLLFTEFLLFAKAQDTGKYILPLIVIITSGIVQWFTLYALKKDEWRFWKDVLNVIRFLSLITFYLGGNYLVIREVSDEVFGLNLQDGEDIPMAMVFYIYTVLIPLLYIGYGLYKKDSLMFRTGLIILAFTVFTFKYYYSLGHHEISLTAAGSIMIIIAWCAIRYFKTIRYGISAAPVKEKEEDGMLNSEALLVSINLRPQSNTATVSHENGNTGGGGSFGGGGADSSF